MEDKSPLLSGLSNGTVLLPGERERVAEFYSWLKMLNIFKLCISCHVSATTEFTSMSGSILVFCHWL
jgi:hypothetical protein